MMSNADLAHGIATGYREAESELCRRMSPRIRHLRSAAAADDLVQQVLLRAIEALRAGRLRDSDKLAPFVLGICRMTVIELRRTAHRQQHLLEEFGGALVPDHRSAPSLDNDRLGRCVQALAERERSVVVMTFYDERPTAEVCVLLGTSEVNVRVIRHRAIGRLRACMGATSMTAPNGSICSSPIEAAVLMDYWLADLPAEAESVVEEHLLACDVCGDRLHETITLAEELRALARSGSLQVIVSDQFLQHAVETGLRLREYAPLPGGEHSVRSNCRR